MSSVISVRIREDVRRILEEEGINMSEEVKKFLEVLALRVRLRRHVGRWVKLLDEAILSEKGFVVRPVREDRESH